MRSQWADAHTDYASLGARPGPRGLADSEADWRGHLENETRNGWLLRGNAMVNALTSGRPIHLMHTTVALDAIRASGQLYASSGCLVAARYCAPLTEHDGALRPHNLGFYLLQTKPHTCTLVFEITPDAPVPPLGIDYLRLGGIHLRTYLSRRSFLTAAEDDQLRRAAIGRVQAAARFLDVLLAAARGAAADERTFVDALARTVPVFPFLGYVYFEVLSEYLLLHSASTETQRCAEAGELNNRLYKRLAHGAVEGMDQLFDLSRFHPRHDELVRLVAGIEPGLAPGAARYVCRRLPHLFACIALAPGQDAHAIAFQGADFEALAQAAPGLLGQLLFREMRITDRYPQLYLAFEQAKAMEAWDFWNAHTIPTPFNGTLPKGEINPAYPRAGCRVRTAETCPRGLVHPVEELDVSLVPRLAELRMTAMRRDGTGKAVGHDRVPVSSGQRPVGVQGTRG
ncbi:hypothetical protein D7231_34005 [Streptomyces klenkii]|uniref:Uncharacterized protein n=1 Tax=Streptomyces klenkii TaxID=1420899 RepID=A0A3B0AHD3_9ACTN|nr:hypothetical protein [Streptomyces klenkii]RKN59691.1 hypothetical protein D7231_34005 [Streptomyces klenkii]